MLTKSRMNFALIADGLLPTTEDDDSSYSNSERAQALGSSGEGATPRQQTFAEEHLEE